ncbi:spermine/spermidine synthase domain-containing protein [Limnoglobus roseus]|uniref:Polyamine aminopropyltransferase n=1 Tax=Limnoglobus roseus TaxID=2598579 RepID=A0A5C1A6Q2_9BACT|nr:hypothetical protein [Limnoglobus roseus]QEL13666.1 Polyamine aminopropyltransferase [Limnoglobus roseus]
MELLTDTQSPSLTTTPMPRGVSKPATGKTFELFLISVVGLFLELMLIRWVTTEIRIFAYLQNTVLVVCFLGLGMGCWDCRKVFALRNVLVPLSVLAGLLAFPPTRIGLGKAITDLLSGSTGLTIWSGDEMSGVAAVVGGAIGLGITLLLMRLLWAIFVPVGQLLGSLLADHPRTLWAYSVNVAGSLVGIWLFVACSAFGLPPVAWFGVFALGAAYWVGSGGKSKVTDALLLTFVVGCGLLAGYEPGWQETRWSPYQKLAVFDYQKPEPTVWAKFGGERLPHLADIGTYMIGVNNVGYQSTIDLRPAVVAANPDSYPPEQRGFSQYDVPPKLHPHPKTALVVGAGSGNDVAGMLRNGIERVVAVEIDPQIIAFGRRLHPEKPYDDPRVVVVNDDARSYFATTQEKFDVIAFGLLDSHTTTAMTNARLDHYVYTLESLTHAKTLLNPGGVALLSFEAQKPYIVDRMARTLTAAFGREPMTFRVPTNGFGWGGVMFVAGDQEAAKAQVAADPRFTTLMAAWQADMPARSATATEMATDDWPYIYLEHRQIPPLYFLLALALGVLFWLGLRERTAPHILRGWERSQTHFFLLGAAFMLLEVQNISKAAVVLGNTWVVSAVIISGILIMILLANALAGWAKKLPAGPVYAALIGTCLGLYFLDLSQFGFLPYWQKAAVVGLLTSLPMLFSGIVFMRSFEKAERKDEALGANLFGSLAGGLLQTVTFVTGIKALLLIVAGLYLLAVLAKPRAKAKA